MADRPKVIIFDVGDTLLSMSRYDRQSGIRALLRHASKPTAATLEELVRVGELLDRELDSRCASRNLEYSQRAFHRLLYGRFGIRFDISDEELEWLYWDEALSFRLEAEVTTALRAAKELEYRLAVISNTTFSADVITRELARQGLGEFFELVLTSADLGIRKPDARVFETAAGLLGVRPGECWYAGNSHHFDVQGAAGAEMRPLWYNRLREESHLPPGTLVITGWSEFPGLLVDG